jgi:hypothetical protein
LFGDGPYSTKVLTAVNAIEVSEWSVFFVVFEDDVFAVFRDRASVAQIAVHAHDQKSIWLQDSLCFGIRYRKSR